MNRRLLGILCVRAQDPFQSVELPEIIEEYLDHGTALCMAFNRRGTLLVSGTKEGQVVIWDFDTRGVAAVLLGHEGPVTSVSWSRNGRYLLSGSEDQHIILWNLLDCSQICRLRLGSRVLRVSLSPLVGPGPPGLAVVSLADGAPVIVDLAAQQLEPMPVAGDGADPAPTRGNGGSGPVSPMVALFSRKGDLIIGCQLRGAISVVDTASRKILDVVRLPNSARVTDLVLNRKGTLLLATCMDQRVRMYEVATRGSLAEQDVPTDAQLAEALANRAIKSGSLLHGDQGLLRPVRDFQNAVERTPWRTATFSCDSEHVVGVTSAKAQLHIYIWNRPLGNMERILEGPKESALELAWHPLRSLLLSCAASGRIYIWAKVHAENWSAFAPDFKELDENTEYVEREDEFDWNTPGAGGELGVPVGVAGGGPAGPDGELDGAGGSGGDGLVIVDILTRSRQAVFSSDDEDSSAQELLYLPVVVERELLPSGRREGSVPGEDGEGEEEGAEGEGEGEPTEGDQQGLLGQGQQPSLLMQMQLGRLAQFPRRGGNGNGGANGNGNGGGSVVDFGRGSVGLGGKGDAGGGGSAVVGEGADMEEEGGGLQGQGCSAEMEQQAAAYGRQQQLLQQQQRQVPGEWGAGAYGEEAVGAERGWLPGGGRDEEMRDVTGEDMEEAGSGLPGRKRKVQFDDGALDMRKGR